MSVMIDGDRIRLVGPASVEDAEPLLAALIDHPGHAVDVSAMTQAHLAIVQLLHAAGRPIAGKPDNLFLREVALAPLIQRKA